MKPKQHPNQPKRQKNYRPGGGSLKDVFEVAAAVGENPRTINTWRRNGITPALDLGFKCKRYDLAAVLAALQKRSIKAK
jgi:hypothetical protein